MRPGLQKLTPKWCLGSRREMTQDDAETLTKEWLKDLGSARQLWAQGLLRQSLYPPRGGYQNRDPHRIAEYQ